MKTYLDCLPCIMRQTLEAVRMATDDPAVQERVARRVLARTLEFSFQSPPPVMGAHIHRIVREETGSADPYREAKARSNAVALKLEEEFRPAVEQSDDPFVATVKLAIAANVIDMGAKANRELTEAAIRAELEEAMRVQLDAGALATFRCALADAEDVLYLADNSGEIAFDRLLIERIGPDRVTVVVRGAPTINDATLEDAEAVGLTKIATVMTNGTATPGTVLDDCPLDLRERFAAADVVISKGQGNYETLSEAPRRVFFLLRAKCPVIARDIGCEVGRLVLVAGGGG